MKLTHKGIEVDVNALTAPIKAVIKATLRMESDARFLEAQVIEEIEGPTDFTKELCEVARKLHKLSDAIGE